MAVLVRSIYVIFGHDKRFFQDMDNISILLSLELSFTPVCRHISMCKKMLLFVTALKFTQIYRYVHIEYFQFSQCFFVFSFLLICHRSKWNLASVVITATKNPMNGISTIAFKNQNDWRYGFCTTFVYFFCAIRFPFVEYVHTIFDREERTWKRFTLTNTRTHTKRWRDR